MFVVLKNGAIIENANELGNYSEGDIISIYGNFYKTSDYYEDEYYVLEIKAILKDVPSERFTTGCGEENQPTQPTVTIENDSVIIRDFNYVYCFAESVLRISDVVNDTLYVTFTDTSNVSGNCMMACMNHLTRISAAKTTPKLSKVYYNGVFYDITTTTAIQNSNKQTISISPNPTEGIVEIKGIENYDNLNYEIYNSAGQVIESGKLKQTIDLTNRKGIYILTIMQNRHIIVREKIIVK